MSNRKDKRLRENFELLHAAAQAAGIEVIEDKINRKGGVCRLDGRLVVVYDVKASLLQRNRLLLEAFTQLEPDKLPQSVRDLLQESLF